MIVYDGSNGKHIDKEIFDSYGKLGIKECYTVVTPPVGVAQTTYTLVHLSGKQRDTAIVKFTKYCSREHEINAGKEWVIYDVSRFKQQLHQHPGFIAMVQQHYRAGAEAAQPTSLYSWTSNPQLRTGGLLASVCRGA